MKTLNNSEVLIYRDENYEHSANYTQFLYSDPITLNIGLKHERTKYIIGAGASDGITLLQDGIFIYVISENKGLNYICMEVINTEAKEIENNVFLQSCDIDEEENICFDILKKNTDEQFKILCEYL